MGSAITTDLSLTKLPGDWSVRSLESLASKIRAGGTPSRSKAEYWNGEIPFAKIEDITGSGGFLASTSEAVTEAGLANSSAWVVPPGAVVLTMYGTIGAVALVQTPLATNQAIIALIPGSEIDSKYLLYALSFWGTGLTRLNVQSTQKNVNAGIVRQFAIPVPPLREQCAIAHVLRTVQRAREQSEQVVAAARELKRSLLRHLFTYGPAPVSEASQVALRSTDQTEVPSHWHVIPLGEVATLQRGNDLPQANRVDGPYPVVGSSGQVGTHSDAFAPGPGVLVGRSGSVGNVAWVDGDYWPLNTTLWVKDFHGNDPRFIFYLLTRFDFGAYISGVSVPTLNRNVVHPIRVGVPPQIREQRHIASMLDVVNHKIDAERRRRDALGELFASLLHDLMSARLRVDHAASEFAR